MNIYRVKKNDKDEYELIRKIFFGWEVVYKDNDLDKCLELMEAIETRNLSKKIENIKNHFKKRFNK